MEFEEANELARKIFIKSSNRLYNNDCTYEEYCALNEAFTGGQPENPCYHCIRRDGCVYHRFIDNLTGCNYRIEEKH